MAAGSFRKLLDARRKRLRKSPYAWEVAHGISTADSDFNWWFWGSSKTHSVGDRPDECRLCQIGSPRLSRI